MIVTIYIDESGTHDSPVVILAGWVGRLGQWAAFDQKWKRLLKKYSLTYFHSKEMRDGDGEFRGWARLKKRQFTSEAARLAMRNVAFGFTITLRVADFKQYYVGNERLKGVSIDSPYGLCFRFGVGIITDLAFQYFKDKLLDVHFVLESGHKNFGNAEAIFDQVLKDKSVSGEEQKIQGALRTISRGDKKKCPGLQIADINAYNAFQYETRDTDLELTDLPPEASSTMSNARKNQKVPIFYLGMTETVLAAFRGSLLRKLADREARREAAFLRRVSRCP